MVTAQEASTMILRTLWNPGVIQTGISGAGGRILAEPVYADRDFPPFDRVAMDGIALQYTTWEQGTRTFRIEGVQAAGEVQKKLADHKNCIEVMTGAILPAGCDVVVRYEDVDISDKAATIRIETLLPWQSIHRQSIDGKKGDALLAPGMTISPAEIALLAAVGKSVVSVYTFPSAAVISTGDELVAIDAIPEPYQIRRSNSYALQAAMKEMGWEAAIFHLEDEESTMQKALAEIARQYDVLILSGGVSRGKFDFVPQVLESIGIHQVFHQVRQRPGKPFWFGRSAAGKIAFALPGNPVSTFMCFYKYVKPWVLKNLGIQPGNTTAILARDFSFAPDLTFFLQVSIRIEEGRRMAYPEAGGGSGDFANLKNVSGFLELPGGKNDFKAGEVFSYISFRN